MGPLNLPARTLSHGTNFKSAYASCSTVVPPAKSGISLKSNSLNAVASSTGRTRRSTKLVGPLVPSPSPTKRLSACT